MRLLLVANGLPPRSWAGVELDTYTLAHALAERHDVWLYVRAEDHARPNYTHWDEVDGPLKVRRVVNNLADPDDFVARFRNPTIERGFDDYLDRVRPDVVHFQHLVGLSAPLLARARSRGIPSVLSLHDFWWICPRIQLLRADLTPCAGPSHAFDCVTCLSDWRIAPRLERRTPLQRIRTALAFQRRAGRSWPRIALILARRALEASTERPPRPKATTEARLRLHDYRLNLMRLLLRFPAVITTPSRFARDYLSAALALPAERIRVVPLGVPAVSVEPRQPAEQLRVVYVGTIFPPKGAHVLVEAGARLGHLGVEIHLYGGDGGVAPYQHKLRAMGGNVVFHGPFRREELGRVLSEIDVLVLPALWPETYSLVLREALAAKLPVVASRIGAIPELIRDGENGLLVTPGSVDELAAVLERLAREPALRERLAASSTPLRTLSDYHAEIEGIYAEIRRR